MSSTIPNHIILGYPYEGAAYWFLSDDKRGGISDYHDHPYYKALYGLDPDNLIPRTTALISLFDTMVIGSANSGLPDYGSCLVGDDYYHPDLRITTNRNYNEWDDSHVELSNQLLKLREVNEILSAIPLLSTDKSLRKHFLCRTILQIRLANHYNGVLIGNSIYQKICNIIFDKIVSEFNDLDKNVEINSFSFEPTTLDIFGLNFPAENIDSFSLIRQSKQISEYANEFRVAISNSLAAANPEHALLLAMKKAMDQEEICKFASGAFQAAGSGANIGGLIPFVGTIASGIGISADVASRSIEKVGATKQWYLLGPKMREIAIKDLLKKL